MSTIAFNEQTNKNPKQKIATIAKWMNKQTKEVKITTIEKWTKSFRKKQIQIYAEWVFNMA